MPILGIKFWYSFCLFSRVGVTHHKNVGLSIIFLANSQSAVTTGYCWIKFFSENYAAGTSFHWTNYSHPVGICCFLFLLYWLLKVPSLLGIYSSDTLWFTIINFPLSSSPTYDDMFSALMFTIRNLASPSKYSTSYCL